MNRDLDAASCNICKMCYRRKSLQCDDACRRCGIALFSEDEVNIYPYSSQSYPYSSQSYPNIQNNMTWPYPPNYPFSYPAYSPNMRSEGILYYNYPRVTNYYYPSMLPYNNYYNSPYRAFN